MSVAYLRRRPGARMKTVQELAALAKARPGHLNYASGGVGSGQHLAGELLKSRAGIDFTHVAYKGGPAAVAAVAFDDSANPPSDS